ncbi:Arb2 domain-containing protein [Podospora australis]|uniref:Arb2 domain-containing protein n=1 Tax=Podospora australis TaxID=1536484 RepID=A0AAN7AIC9_9PEZI|nr:Arb2 domain-containing protein [Podospora australis]
MFRRRWSGLPADPTYATDLHDLGYFVNEDDEIRSLEDPDYYFKYFLTKNHRWNDRQRFCFNEAIGKVIRTRLSAEGLSTIRLPLGTPPNEPHVPISMSADLPAHATRVVLFFGETSQEFGVLAHRVLGGPGGINKGSAVSLVQALQTQPSSSDDDTPPGIIIANPGELYWWPEGRRGLTPVGRHNIPMSSAVHYGWRYDAARNAIPQNKDCQEHIRCVFEQVVEKLVNKHAKLDVVAVGDTADEVEGYLNDEVVWEKLGPRMNSLVVMGGFYDSADFKCDGFAKFLRERGRAYTIHHSPLDNLLAGYQGNPQSTASFAAYGCPTFSAGPETCITETMPIDVQPAVLPWLRQVALDGDKYRNEDHQVYGDDSAALPPGSSIPEADGDAPVQCWADEPSAGEDQEIVTGKVVDEKQAGKEISGEDEKMSEVEEMDLKDNQDENRQPTEEKQSAKPVSKPVPKPVTLEDVTRDESSESMGTIAAAEHEDEKNIVLGVRDMNLQQ